MHTDDMHITCGGLRFEPGKDPDEQEVEVCRKFLKQFCEHSDERTKNSYSMKHVVERWAPTTDYVSNGALIQAADDLGYDYDVIRDGPNADIYMNPDGFCEMKRQKRGIEEMYRVLKLFVDDSEIILSMLSSPEDFQNGSRPPGEKHLRKIPGLARNLASAVECFDARRRAKNGSLYRCKEAFTLLVDEDERRPNREQLLFDDKTLFRAEPGDYLWFDRTSRAIAKPEDRQGLYLIWLERPIPEVEKLLQERLEKPIHSGDYQIQFEQEGAAWRAEIDHDEWESPEHVPPLDMNPWADGLEPLCDEVEAQLGIEGGGDRD